MLERLDDAAKLTGVDPDIHRLLRRPKRVLEVSVPVRMDDGRVEVFTGWRVHHDTTRGPAKGGIRFHPGLEVNEVIALAASLTLKTAVAGRPVCSPAAGPRCGAAARSAVGWRSCWRRPACAGSRSATAGARSRTPVGSIPSRSRITSTPPARWSASPVVRPPAKPTTEPVA